MLMKSFLLLPCLTLALTLGCKGKSTSTDAPVITSCSAPSFLVNSQVTLTGSGFTDTLSVNLNGVFITTFTVLDDAHLLCTIPADAVSGPFSLSTNLGNAVSANVYNVIPQITAISPNSGPPGTLVNLTGSGFVGASQLLFGTEQAGNAGNTTFTVDGANQITAIIGINATTGTPSLLSSGLPSSTPASPALTFTVTAPS